MNLGFDLDKVFINYPPFVPSYIIDRLYKKKANGTLLYRIPARPEQLLRIATHFPLFRPPIKENIHFVKLLAQEKNHKRYLISSRFGFLEKQTQAIIKKYHFHSIFDDMFFNFHNKQPHLFKNEVIKKLGIHMFIDDDLPLLKFLAKQNKKTTFFWLNNKTDALMTKNIIGITHMKYIRKEIKKT